MKHVMLDLETLSTSSNAVIISIAAVQFNIETGEIINKFHRNVDIQSCLDIGMEIEANTIKWWMTQKNETFKKLINNTVTIKKAINSLRIEMIAIDRNKQNIIVYANSPSFDCVIIKNACKKTKIEYPFNYRNEVCIRTLFRYFPEIVQKHKFKGNKHNPIDDCINQINILTEINNKFKLFNNQNVSLT